MESYLRILIPSEEMRIPVYPMDYEEFLWACGKDTYDLLRQVAAMNRPIGNATNRVLMRDFRIYMAVGGMPQAVEAYVGGKNFSEIDVIKREIINLYKDDFRKIDLSGRISAIFESIPSQLANKKKRFVLSRATGSSDTGKHTSIDVFSKKYSKVISRRILFSQKDIGNDGMLELKPIYLAPIIIGEM